MKSFNIASLAFASLAVAAASQNDTFNATQAVAPESVSSAANFTNVPPDIASILEAVKALTEETIEGVDRLSEQQNVPLADLFEDIPEVNVTSARNRRSSIEKRFDWVTFGKAALTFGKRVIGVIGTCCEQFNEPQAAQICFAIRDAL